MPLLPICFQKEDESFEAGRAVRSGRRKPSKAAEGVLTGGSGRGSDRTVGHLDENP